MAEELKGSLTPKAQITDPGILDADIGSALTATDAALTGGQVGAAQVRRAREAAAQPLASTLEDQNRPLEDVVGAAFREGTVLGRAGELLNQAADNFDTSPIDRTFNAGAYGVKRLAQLGITPNERYAAVLATASDQEEAEAALTRIQQYEMDSQIVAQNPVTALAVSALDPVALAIDSVTFGAGKAAGLGRLGMAIAGAGSQIAYTGTMEAVGMEVDASTYILGAALGAGVGGLLGAGPARSIDQDLLPTPRPSVAEVPEVVTHFDGTLKLDGQIKQAQIPTVARQPDAFEVRLTEAADNQPASKAARFLAEDTTLEPGLRAVAGRVWQTLEAMEAAGQRTVFRVIKGGDRAPEDYLNPGVGGTHITHENETLVGVRGATAPGLRVGANPVTTLHELTHAATVQAIRQTEQGGGTEATRLAVKDLNRTLDFVKSELRRRADAGEELSEFEQAALAGRNNSLRNTRELAAWGLSDKRMQRLLNSVRLGDSSTWSRFVTAVRGLLGLRPDADTALSRVLQSSDTLMQDAPGLSALAASWANKGAPVAEQSFETAKQHASRMNGYVQRFLSEADKLAPTPETRELLGRLIDDPVRREGFSTNNNAASFLRRYRNEFDGYVKRYDDEVRKVLRERGVNWTHQALNTAKATAARDALNDEVAAELLRRDAQWTSMGRVVDDPTVDPRIKALADISDDIHGRMGTAASEAGVLGFDGFTARPGYFHRSWNFSKITRMDEVAPGTAANLLGEAVFRGFGTLERDEALTIAKAIIQRAQDRATGQRSEFMGALGQADTAFIREALEAAKVSQVKLDSIMGKIEQKASDQGTVKFGKKRLTIDMDTEINVNGQVLRVRDLIDTDMDRLIENYAGSMSGRSALARIGIAGDSDIEAFIRQYVKALPHQGQQDVMELTTQLRGVFGDFTGNIPEQHQLGPVAQRAIGLTSATMLGFSGIYQVAELATIAHRQGIAATAKELFKNDTIRNILNLARKDKDLADELNTVLGLDLARDVRMRPWKRQFDTFVSANDTVLDRVLHSGRQATPVLNGMQYVHSIQSRMNANLTLNRIARAAAGDEDSIAVLRAYGKDVDWDTLLPRVRGYVTLSGKNATSMNWQAWPKADLDTVMNTALRIMDDSVLYGRVGQNAGFARSPVGQVLGQFRSFVSFSHNKLLRGTFQNQGVRGLSTLLAMQYPLTVMMIATKQGIQGDLDLSDKGIKKLVKDSIGYTAALGYTSDLWGIVSGHSRLSAPVFGLADRTGEVFRGVRSLATGDPAGVGEAAHGAAGLLPFVNVFPATKFVIESLGSE